MIRLGNNGGVRRIAGAVRAVQLLPAGLTLALALLLVAACSPTEGNDGKFDPVATTNFDFQAPSYVTLGNLPISMDYTTTNFPTDKTGTLVYVAAVNNVADPPLYPDGSLNPTGTVSVVQNAAGVFTTTATLTTLEFPTKAMLANLDGNANPDLIVLDDQNLHVAVYLATGAGTYSATPDQEFTLNGSASQAAIADLEGDGDDDVVLTVTSTNELIALVNDGSGTLTLSTTTVSGPSRFVAGDMDGDSSMDLAILQGGTNTVTLWEWGGAAFAQTLATTGFTPGYDPQQIVGADFLGLGRLDLAILLRTSDSATDALEIRANTDGLGTFGLSSSILLPKLASHVFALGAVGSAGPGADLAVTHTNSRYITYVHNNGSGGFANSLPETTRNPVEVIADPAVLSGDITGDGNADMVTVETEKRAIGIFAGNGAGAFTRTQIGLLTKPTFPRLVDIDGDGVLDLMVLEPNSDRMAVFLNVH